MIGAQRINGARSRFELFSDPDGRPRMMADSRLRVSQARTASSERTDRELHASFSQRCESYPEGGGLPRIDCDMDGDV